MTTDRARARPPDGAAPRRRRGPGRLAARRVAAGTPTRGSVGRIVAGRVAAGALVAMAFGVAAGCGGDGGGSSGDRQSDRQEDVARRGAAVMPFDLDATTHHFEPVAGGLVETVVADDPGDAEQVALIRDHLAAEAERFAGGDYADPAAIHGDDMPGLAELRAGAADVTVAYRPVEAGGRITFTTADPALVDALHRWGEAQTSDHGTHAESHPAPS